MQKLKKLLAIAVGFFILINGIVGQTRFGIGARGHFNAMAAFIEGEKQEQYGPAVGFEIGGHAHFRAEKKTSFRAELSYLTLPYRLKPIDLNAKQSYLALSAILQNQVGPNGFGLEIGATGGFLIQKDIDTNEKFNPLGLVGLTQKFGNVQVQLRAQHSILPFYKEPILLFEKRFFHRTASLGLSYSF